VYGGDPPPFHVDLAAIPLPSIPARSTEEEATRALLRELRVQLKQDNMYKGSKLELMDCFGVKLSALAQRAIFVDAGCLVAPKPSRPTAVVIDDRSKKGKAGGKRQKGSLEVATPPRRTARSRSTTKRMCVPTHHDADEGYE